MVKARGSRRRKVKDSHFSQTVAFSLREEDPISGEWEGASKNGILLTEVRRINIAKRSGLDTTLSGQGRENSTTNPQLSNVIQKEEDGEDGTAESLVAMKVIERDSPVEEAVPRRRKRKAKMGVAKPASKKRVKSGYRWSEPRYEQAKQHLLDILRAKKAVFGNAMTRPELRKAGREHIGDTGLLDHLLRHIDGEVVPGAGGEERFRRWFNTDGVMEYWLESAELHHIRDKAKVEDPFWVPPSNWKPGGCGPLEEPASCEDMKLVKEDILNMKRQLAELDAMKKDQNDASLVVECIPKEYLIRQAKTEEKVIEMSCSLSGMQDMYRALISWKEENRKKLVELSNAVSIMDATKAYSQPPASPNSECWKNYLESNQVTNFEDTQEDEISKCMNMESADLKRGIGPYSSQLIRSNPEDVVTTVMDAAYKSEIARLKQEVASMKRDMKDLMLKDNDLIKQMQAEMTELKTNTEQQMAALMNNTEQQMRHLLNIIEAAANPRPLTGFYSPPPTIHHYG